MPTARVITRLAAFAAATAGAVVASLALASPAHAADVEVRIGNVPDITAGAQPKAFDSITTNRDKVVLANVRHVIEVRLDGLQPGQIKIAKGLGGQQLHVEATGNGEVRAVDQDAVDLAPEGRPGSVRRMRYWIAFTPDAPNGRADLTFGAFVGDGALLDTDSDGFTVRGPAGQTTKNAPTSAPATSADPVPTFAAGPELSIAPLPDNQAVGDDNSGVPIVLYVLGGILVAAGGAILWMLFRPRPEFAAYPTSDYPVNPQMPAYPPMSTAGVRPTAVMPTIRDPRTMPQPGVDPWAPGPGSAEGPTREIGPFGTRQ